MKDVIKLRISVERETQKGILIGAGGAALKALMTASRKAVESFLERCGAARWRRKLRRCRCVLRSASESCSGGAAISEFPAWLRREVYMECEVVVDEDWRENDVRFTKLSLFVLS